MVKPVMATANRYISSPRFDYLLALGEVNKNRSYLLMPSSKDNCERTMSDQVFPVKLELSYCLHGLRYTQTKYK